MILVLFLLGLIILIVLVIFLILLSTLKINIDKAYVSNDNNEEKMYKEFLIYLQLYLFGKIKIFSMKFDNRKMKKYHFKERAINLERYMIERKDVISKDTYNDIKKLNIVFEKFNLHMCIGTENVILTSSAVCLISSIISILLSLLTRNSKDINEFKYEIKPIYQDKNIIKINLNCIINIKMVHIIYVTYLFFKKGRVKVHGRTSNRGTYDYSYE